MPCNHCGFGGELEQKLHGVIKRVTSDNPSTGPIDFDTIARVRVCPVCDKLTLERYHWHDFLDPGDVDIEVLYPPEPDLSGLPARVEKEYARARRVRAEPVFYTVAIRRTLEAICSEEGIEGRTLAERLSPDRS
jgi:hypothetical protein